MASKTKDNIALVMIVIGILALLMLVLKAMNVI